MRGHVRPYELKNRDRAWAVIIYQGKRLDQQGKLKDKYRWMRGFKTKKAAETELSKQLRAIDDGTYIEASKQTLGEFLDHWLRTVRPHLAGKTFERYNHVVQTDIKPKLGSVLPAKVQPLQLAEFYSWASRAGGNAEKAD